MTIDQMQDFGMNLVENICGAISMPAEMILRPWYGSRFFSPTEIFLSTGWMTLLPLLSSTADAVTHLIPFMHAAPPPGLFDIGSLAKLYFLMGFGHGVRVYRRMIHPEREDDSRFSGPPLPFFHLIPGSGSWWFTRIALEPAFLVVAATILANFFILQPGLSAYLHFMAVALAMKNFVAWYRSWCFIRDILDAQNAGPTIAKIVNDSATEEEMARINLASFPRNISPSIRKNAAQSLAQLFSVRIPETQPNPSGESDDNIR